MEQKEELNRMRNRKASRMEKSRISETEFRERALQVLRSEFGSGPPAALQEESPGYGVPPADGSAASARRASPAPGPAAEPEVIPARMLNEFVYCPRLFFYEFVEGQFRESADTLKGSAIHQRVDSGRGALPEARRAAPESGEEERDAPSTSAGDGEVIHARSVQMGSDRLGVTAKMDLVEVRAGKRDAGEIEGNEPAREEDLFDRLEVCPVDYKAGSPKEEGEASAGGEGPRLWDADKMQLGLQMLILRDNGYKCDEGIIYYRGTKQRVRLQMTDSLEEWIEREISEARRTARGTIPPPLVNSPKCVGCSLAPICLPDETRLLSSLGSTAESPSGSPDSVESRSAPCQAPAQAAEPRRLMAARDDCRALYLNTPGLRIGVKGETLQVKEREKLLDTVRVRDVAHVALFGNIQISTQAVQSLCENEIPIAYFSMGGWFYGMTRGHELKNVFLRKRQFQAADRPEERLPIARQIVHGKIRNHRVLLRRNHVESPEVPLRKLKVQAENALGARSIEELLGIEGAAASLYFQNLLE